MLTETRESLTRIMDVDCWGVYNGMHYCAPAIIEAGGGTIVNTCSYQGTHFGPGSFIGYAMAKAAVMGMTRAAAADLGTYGIRVNAVSPGLVLSGMTMPRGQNRAGLVDASSMKRYALPEEIASVVLFPTHPTIPVSSTASSLLPTAVPQRICTWQRPTKNSGSCAARCVPRRHRAASHQREEMYHGSI